MSKLEASDIISNQTPCPNYYIDHLKDFLDNLSKSKITKSSNQTEGKKEPDLHLLAAIANQGQGE